MTQIKYKEKQNKRPISSKSGLTPVP